MQRIGEFCRRRQRCIADETVVRPSPRSGSCTCSEWKAGRGKRGCSAPTRQGRTQHVIEPGSARDTLLVVRPSSMAVAIIGSLNVGPRGPTYRAPNTLNRAQAAREDVQRAGAHAVGRCGRWTRACILVVSKVVPLRRQYRGIEGCGRAGRNSRTCPSNRRDRPACPGAGCRVRARYTTGQGLRCRSRPAEHAIPPASRSSATGRAPPATRQMFDSLSCATPASPLASSGSQCRRSTIE